MVKLVIRKTACFLMQLIEVIHDPIIYEQNCSACVMFFVIIE